MAPDGALATGAPRNSAETDRRVPPDGRGADPDHSPPAGAARPAATPGGRARGAAAVADARGRARLARLAHPAAFRELLLAELRAAAEAFWLRRGVRRRALRNLARDCAAFAPRLRRRAAELRAGAARARLERLRAAATAAPTGGARDGPGAALEEVGRTLAALALQMDVDASQVEEQPSMLKGGSLMEHQMRGLRWLVALTDNQMSGILADDMGLGKTVQALAFLAYLAEHRAEHGPHLILVPFGLLSHWVDEFTTWLPDFHYVVFRGAERQMLALRRELVRGINKVHAVLTTFETMVAHHEFLSSLPWFCVIADEGHRLKNLNTRVSRSCHDLPCRHRLLLTGTPVQNSLDELWSLLSFVAPQAFGSLGDFHAWFALPPPPSVRLRDAPEPEPERVLGEEEEFTIIRRLHGVLRPFLLRRTKDLVLADLPERRNVVIRAPLSAWQRTLYDGALRRLGHLASGTPEDPTGTERGTAPVSVVRLRQAVNHPYHFLKGDSLVTAPEEDLVRASGKFELLDRILPRFLQFGHKVLIFAQMTSLLSLLEKLLLQRGMRYRRIDGSMSIGQRRDAMNTFRVVPDIGILLLSTRAGGLGLNLQVADTVILFDSDWNPQVDAQAMDRVHRIGQQRPVLSIRLLTPTSLDTGLLARVCGKLEIERKVISAGNFNHTPGSEVHTGAVLRELLQDARRAGASQAVSGSASTEATPLAEVNRLLARSPEERMAFDASDDLLLGPPAAGDAGEESTTERLERCGRLMRDLELPNPARRSAAPLLPPRRRRRPRRAR